MEKDNVLLEMKYHYSNDCQHNNVKCSDNKVFGLSVENIEDAKEFVESNNLVDQEIIIDYGILGNKYSKAGNRKEVVCNNPSYVRISYAIKNTIMIAESTNTEDTKLLNDLLSDLGYNEEDYEREK